MTHRIRISIAGGKLSPVYIPPGTELEVIDLDAGKQKRDDLDTWNGYPCRHWVERSDGSAAPCEYDRPVGYLDWFKQHLKTGPIRALVVITSGEVEYCDSRLPKGVELEVINYDIDHYDDAPCIHRVFSYTNVGPDGDMGLLPCDYNSESGWREWLAKQNSE